MPAPSAIARRNGDEQRGAFRMSHADSVRILKDTAYGTRTIPLNMSRIFETSKQALAAPFACLPGSSLDIFLFPWFPGHPE